MSLELDRSRGYAFGLLGLLILSGRLLIVAPLYNRANPSTAPPVYFSIGYEGLGENLFENDFIRATATVDVALTYPKSVSPEDSFPVEARVRLNDVKVEARNTFNKLEKLPQELQMQIKFAAHSRYQDLLRASAVGLTLRLAGAEVQPKEAAPIVESRASWSVKPFAKGQLNGFLSPFVRVPERFQQELDIPDIRLTNLTLSGTPPLQITVRPPFSDTLWSRATAVGGTLLTIPGLVAFILDLQKRREERKKRREEEQKAREEERVKAERDRKIVLP